MQLKRRGSDSKLLTQLLAQLPSSTEWEEGTFCASLYHHPQHSVGVSEKVLLLASKPNPKEAPYRGLPAKGVLTDAFLSLQKTSKTLLSWRSLATCSVEAAVEGSHSMCQDDWRDEIPPGKREQHGE